VYLFTVRKTADVTSDVWAA